MLFKSAVYETALTKVGETIRRLRQERGYSQETFAQYAQIERARYGKIERGQLNPSWRLLFHLAACLEVSPSYLVEDVSLEDCLEPDADR